MSVIRRREKSSSHRSIFNSNFGSSGNVPVLLISHRRGSSPWNQVQAALAQAGPQAAVATLGVAKFVCVALGLGPTLQLTNRGFKSAISKVKRKWRTRHWRSQRAPPVPENEHEPIDPPPPPDIWQDASEAIARSQSDGHLTAAALAEYQGSGMSRTQSVGSLSLDMSAEIEGARRRVVPIRRCAVCWHHDSEMVFWPCGHVCICTTCAPSLQNPKRCVACNKSGKLPVRVYFP